MRKQVLFCAVCAMIALLAGVSSCQKMPANTTPVVPEEGCANVSFTLSNGVGAGTKTLTGEANEKTLQNVQIFVFKGGSGADAGILEISYSDGFAAPLNSSTGTYTTLSSIRCSVGPKDIYVICNDAYDRTKAGYAIRTKKQLLNQTSELRDNASNRLLMVGSLNKTLSAGNQTCSVELKRMCAAIVLRSIRNAFLSPAYQSDGVFRIIEAYLLNVPAFQNFNMEAPLDPSVQDASRWYNKLAVDNDSASKALTYDPAGSSPVILNHNSTYGTAHTFYMYPNSCPLREEPYWSATGRATLLVVKTQINVGAGWIDSYYSVPLTASTIKSNCKYYVDLTVNRPGSDDPNKPVKFSDLTPTIIVLPWEDGEVYTPEI